METNHSPGTRRRNSLPASKIPVVGVNIFDFLFHRASEIREPNRYHRQGGGGGGGREAAENGNAFTAPIGRWKRLKCLVSVLAGSARSLAGFPGYRLRDHVGTVSRKGQSGER